MATASGQHAAESKEGWCMPAQRRQPGIAPQLHGQVACRLHGDDRVAPGRWLTCRRRAPVDGACGLPRERPRARSSSSKPGGNSEGSCIAPASDTIPGVPGRGLPRGVERAAAEAIAAAEGADSDLGSAVADFVAGRIDRMPFHIRLPVRLVGSLLVAGSWARTGVPFSRLDLERRRGYLNAWERAPLPPLRQYPRLVRALALLCVHETHPPGGRGQ